MVTAQRVFKFTYEDYRTAPPDKRYELLDGDLVMTPAPNLKHQRVQVRLGERLARFVREHALGEFFFAPCDVVLSDTDVVPPDLLFVSKERAHLLSGGDNVQGAPDLVVEILSTGHRRAGPGLQARSLREARRGGVLAGRPRVGDGVGSPAPGRRTGGRPDSCRGTHLALATACRVRPGDRRRLRVLNRDSQAGTLRTFLPGGTRDLQLQGTGIVRRSATPPE